MMSMRLTLNQPRRFCLGLILGAPAVLLFATLAVAQESKTEGSAGPSVEKARADDSEAPKPAADKEETKTPERIFKTNDEWRKLLTHDQFLVTRMKATEPPFSGKYATGHFKGTFLCVCCGAKLFDARHKFDSGTGWPSFWRPLIPQNLEESIDRSEIEPRIEVTCTRCGAHLGHVFSDGPPPTGLRYCIDSLSLKLDTESDKATTTRKPASRTTKKRRVPSAGS